MGQQVETRADAHVEMTRQAGPEVGAPVSGRAADGAPIETQPTLRLVLRPHQADVLLRASAQTGNDTLAVATPSRIPARPLALTLLFCLVLLLVVGALDGMQQYARIHTQVADAVSHLRAAHALLDARSPAQPLDAARLDQLDAQVTAADQDFQQLRTELGTPSGVVQVGTLIPRLSGRIADAADLALAADDACQGSLDLLAAARDLLELRADGFLDANGQLTRHARLTPAAGILLTYLRAHLTHAAAHFDAAAAHTPLASLTLLPPGVATPGDVAALQGQVGNWAQLRAPLTAVDGWRLLVPFVLGASTPRG